MNLAVQDKHAVPKTTYEEQYTKQNKRQHTFVCVSILCKSNTI